MDGDDKVLDWLVKGQTISLHIPVGAVNLLDVPIGHNPGLYWFFPSSSVFLTAFCQMCFFKRVYGIFASSPVHHSFPKNIS